MTNYDGSGTNHILMFYHNTFCKILRIRPDDNNIMGEALIEFISKITRRYTHNDVQIFVLSETEILEHIIKETI